MEGTQNGTYYSVQARSKSKQPYTMKNGQTIAGEWARVKFIETPIGVSAGITPKSFAHTLGVFDYASAKALQMWVIADQSVGDYETRIMSHSFSLNYSLKEGGAESPVSWSDNRFTELKN